MGFRSPLLVLSALVLGSCSPESVELGGVGASCRDVSECEAGLFCSPVGECYDPNAEADGDADADSDADSDGDSDSDGDTPCLLPDGDGDTIADLHEGEGDVDEDGLPNSADDDSDGDGIADAVEAGDDDVCTAPRDGDMDGRYDFLDLDADSDGLTDSEEALLGSSPFHEDTDGDGHSDFVERAAGTRPDDGTDYPSDDALIFILPYEDPGGAQTRELPLATSIRIADVFFLMDTTGSMSEEIANLREGLSGIASSLAGLLDDVAMGVGRFDDFPLPPYGDVLAGDRVFELVQQVTSDETIVQAAVDGLTVRAGLDLPESQVPALWHVATGEPIGAYVTRAAFDPTVEGTGDIGGAAFRDDAQPIVVLVTDAPMHNDAAGRDAYDDLSLGTTAPLFADAATELEGIGARVVGIGGADATSDLSDMARETGTVLAGGEPLVYGINPDGTAEGGGDLSSQVSAGIEDLVLGTPQDVSTVQEDDPADEVDARQFIDAIRPLRGLPERPDGYQRHDGDGNPFGSFFSVIPGTEVVFEVEAYNDFIEAEESSQVFRMTVVLVGNGVTRLDERPVVIVVPAVAAEVPIY